MIQKVDAEKQLVWLVTGTLSVYICLSYDNARSDLTLRLGASSGLGLALVKRILARGDRVIATARTPSKFADLFPSGFASDQLHTLHLDVTAPFSSIQREPAAPNMPWQPRPRFVVFPIDHFVRILPVSDFG